MLRFLVVAAILMPGCLDVVLNASPCPPPTGWALAGPYLPDGNISAFPETGNYQRILYVVRNPLDRPAHVGFALGSQGETDAHWKAAHFAEREDPLPPNGTWIGGATPPFEVSDTKGADHWVYEARLTLDRDDCRPTAQVTIPFGFETTTPGESADPGLGVQVLTAGFWTNGTLFYTNMKRVHDDANFSRAGWYEWEGSDPLPVYIYNVTRTELPPRYNQSGYVTTIPGFNRAPQSMFVGTSFVADLQPEEAYTRPGNEQHSLYGDEIVFYIEIVDVVAIDCPYPQPVCEVPQAPPVHERTSFLGG